MPDSDLLRPITIASGVLDKSNKPTITIGVVGHGGQWSLYSPVQAPVHFDTREGAVIAAEERVLAAARDGRCVEFFLQEEDGAFRQTTVCSGASAARG